MLMENLFFDEFKPEDHEDAYEKYVIENVYKSTRDNIFFLLSHPPFR